MKQNEIEQMCTAGKMAMNDDGFELKRFVLIKSECDSRQVFCQLQVAVQVFCQAKWGESKENP